MPGVPSNRACERCKKRHVKCDETRPRCQRCTSAGVECPGYVQTRKFIDQGPTIRRRYAPYQESHSRIHAEKPLDQLSEPAENVILETDSASARQSPLNFPMPTPTTDGPREAGGDTESPPKTHRPQSTLPLRDSQNHQGGLSVSAQLMSNLPGGGQNSAGTGYPAGFGFSPSVPRNLVRDQILATGESSSSNTPDTDAEPAPPDPSLIGTPSIQIEQENFYDIFSELMTGTEHEIAFLTRHFSEFLGPWLDLSDSSKFFAVYAPIRAINNDFLKYAIAALSAKHLGRMNGQKPPAVGGIFTSPASMEIYPNSERVDWVLKGENYYCLALIKIRAVVSDGYSSVSSSAMLGSPIEAIVRWLNLQLRQDALTNTKEVSDPDSFLRKVEALLGACVILTMYKLLEAPGEHWQSHLVGIEPLFDCLLQLRTGPSAISPLFTHGERAALWNFARQDYLGSYLTRSPTHLKHENLSLWRAAGIRISEQEPREDIPGISLDDLAANTLIRLMNKVVNFLADFKRSQVAQWTESEEPAQPTTSTWLNLCFEFQSWLEKVPETFRPSLRIERPRDMSNLSEATYIPFPEVFYSLPSCAATMQHYHFGRMALLLNRPPDALSAPGTAFDRLASLREVTKEVDHRCREICGIALSRPRAEVRVYMVPLLFAAGQCLEAAEARQVIVDLLRGVEADLGVATLPSVEKLQWAWSQ